MILSQKFNLSKNFIYQMRICYSMRKLSFLLCLIFIVPIVFLTGCGEEQNLCSYSLVITYDDENKSAQGACVVDYVNTSDNAFDYILFHLYSNAFSEEGDGLVCSTSNESKTYPNGKSFGGIEIVDVKIAGSQVEYSVEGEADMLLKVQLEQQLFPDENVKIEIDFNLKLPNANHRFGYGENAVNFGNFYPIACVYENGKGFMSEGYVANGDPFYSDVANYSVTVSYPKKLKIACSGDNIKTNDNGQYFTTTFSSSKVRDVSFVLSENFSVISAKSGDCLIEYYYYNDDDPQGSLETAVKAVEFYSETFGDYPYSSLSVVQTNFVHGGMEYPRLVMISDTVAGLDYDYVIAHEIAHQWWYGVVGNDEYNESWLDESLTEYSTALFFENYGEYNITYDKVISGAESNYKFFLSIYNKIQGEVDTSMLRALDEFNTEPEYINNIYTRGVLLFDTLRSELGNKKLNSTLKAYFKEFAYKNVNTSEFISYFSSKSGRNLEKFFNSWLNGEVEFVYV